MVASEASKHLGILSKPLSKLKYIVSSISSYMYLMFRMNFNENFNSVLRTDYSRDYLQVQTNPRKTDSTKILIPSLNLTTLETTTPPPPQQGPNKPHRKHKARDD